MSTFTLDTLSKYTVCTQINVKADKLDQKVNTKQRLNKICLRDVQAAEIRRFWTENYKVI